MIVGLFKFVVLNSFYLSTELDATVFCTIGSYWVLEGVSLLHNLAIRGRGHVGASLWGLELRRDAGVHAVILDDIERVRAL